MKTRKALLAIAVVTAVCFAFYGCDDSASSGSDETGSGSGSGSGSVVSCYVELPGGNGSASCSEVPTSYRTTDKFKETCEAQNIEGVSKATFGSGCPAGGKKCDQGGGIVAYYYGAAAEVNSCLGE